MWSEFKKFALRGNVLDLAVGVIIGAAFGKIVSSVVDEIFMPLLGLLVGGIDLTGWSVTVGEATIQYGNFLQAVLDFFIVAFAIFIFIRYVNRLRAKQEEAPAAPPPPPRTEVLLEEIRDLLQKR